MSRYTQKWPTRGPSKEEWLPSKGGVGTGDINHKDHEFEEKLVLTQIVDAMVEGCTPKKLTNIGDRFGWTRERLERAILSARSRVVEGIRLKALAASAAALESQAELAKTDVAAFKEMNRVAQLVDGTGPHLNVAIDARKMGDTNSDRAFFESYHRRIDAMHDPVPEDPPTPEEAVVGADPENLEDTEPEAAPDAPQTHP